MQVKSEMPVFYIDYILNANVYKNAMMYKNPDSYPYAMHQFQKTTENPLESLM